MPTAASVAARHAGDVELRERLARGEEEFSRRLAEALEAVG